MILTSLERFIIKASYYIVLGILSLGLYLSLCWLDIAMIMLHSKKCQSVDLAGLFVQ